ncbi:ATP-grasp domain-containing protein [Haloarchaeobius baliensis]|uniref:ATP-grasp domain-containing protein n=1 Tax=Haloarchaeobius baliensis TaxID=1670458 RepID=UPI003F883C9B
MTQNSLLILGAGTSYVDLIRGASDVCSHVVVTDQDETAPGFAAADDSEPVDIMDIDGTREVAEMYGVDGVLPVNDYGVRTAAVVSDELDLPGIKPSVASRCIDKAEMRRQWEKAGLSQPDFEVVTTLEGAHEAFDSIPGTTVFKPADSTGGGSRGVSIVEDASEVADAFSFAQSPYDDDERIIVEEMAVGSEHSIEVVTVPNDDPTVVAISDKEKTPLPYRVDKSVIYPTKSEARQQIADAAIDAVDALGIDFGAAHVELAYTDEGPKLFELGARCGGGATADPIVPAVTGIPYFQNIAKLYSGDTDVDFEPKKRDGVTYRFLTPEPGILESVSGVDTVRQRDDVLSCRIWIEPDDTIEPVKEGHDRCGSVITHGPTRDSAYQSAEEAESLLEFHIKDE